MSFTGSDSFAAMISGDLAISTIGTNCSGSYGMFLYISLLLASGPGVPNSSV